MPRYVSDTQLFQKNHPAGPPVFGFEHERLQSVEATRRHRSEGSARYLAEYDLVGRANHPFAIVDVEYSFDYSGERVSCTVTGVPVKKLEASGGGRG